MILDLTFIIHFVIIDFKLKTQWCKQIFNDSHSIVISLLTKCVEEFNKTFAKLIDNLYSMNELSSSNDAKSNLEYLNQFKQVIVYYSFD